MAMKLAECPFGEMLAACYCPVDCQIIAITVLRYHPYALTDAMEVHYSKNLKPSVAGAGASSWYIP
jgi:hypothetical protein